MVTESTGCTWLQIVVHVSTNYSCHLGSEVILGSFRWLADLVKTASITHRVEAELSICSIVLGTDHGQLIWNCVKGLN